MKMKPFSTIFGFALFFVFATLFTACKKDDVENKTVISKFNTDKFFAGTENADLPTKKLVDFFKTKHAQNPNFLPNLVRQCGYPVWDKTIKQYPSGSIARSTTEGTQDSVIHLPFVHQNTTVVNSFVEALINDTIEVELYEKYKYTSLPKGQINATGLTAEKYLNQFLFLQKRVFNHKFFKIVDTTLFKSLTPNNGANNAVVKFIKLEESTASGTQVNSFDPNCFHYTTSYRTYELINGLWTFTQHTRHHVICFPPVQSFIMAEGGGPGVIGSISGFNWSGIDPLGGGGSNAGGTLGTGGTPIGNNPSGGYNGNGPNATIGFLDAEELFYLLNQLKTHLPNLTANEEGFLLDHSNQLREIVNYLNANNTQEAKDKVKLHIDKMINDPYYYNIVVTHTNTTTLSTVWWDDNAWFMNPTNQLLLQKPGDDFYLYEFPIDVPEQQEINNGIEVIPISPNDPLPPPVAGLPKFSTADRGNTEDLTHGYSGQMLNANDESYYSQLSNSELESKMDLLFRALTILSGFDIAVASSQFQQKFKTNSYNSYEYENQIVNKKVEESGVFRTFVKKVGEEINKGLKLTNGDFLQLPSSTILDQGIRPVFNGTYHKYHGLQILINDTEKTDVELFSTYFNPATGDWEVGAFVTIYDHFGLDKQDMISYPYSGFKSWWALQHTRNYIPFITKIVNKVKIKGNIYQ